MDVYEAHIDSEIEQAYNLPPIQLNPVHLPRTIIVEELEEELEKKDTSAPKVTRKAA